MMSTHIMIALAVIVALISWDDYSVRSRNERLLKQEGIYRAQLETLQGNVTGLTAEIEDTNRRLGEIREVATKKEKEVKLAQDAARISAESNVKFSNFLLAARPTGSNICESTEQLFNQYLEKRQSR